MPTPAGRNRGTRRRTRPVDRSFTANVLGALALTLTDRTGAAAASAAGHGGHAPAALLTLLWYPDRPIGALAARLRISHPGAVQLVDRLERDGMVDRIPGADGRTRLVTLSGRGERAAAAVLAARRHVLELAVSVLDDAHVRALADASSAILEVLTGDLLTGEHMCRLCDEAACPDARCPVERAEPAPPHRRGTGYGVRPG